MTDKPTKSKPRRGRPKKSTTKKPATKKPASEKSVKQQPKCCDKFCICVFLSKCWNRIRSFFC